MENEIEAPVINCELCNHKSPMEIVSQNHNKKIVEINYKCKCGSYARVLYSGRGNYHLYIYDKEGNMAKYNSFGE